MKIIADGKTYEIVAEMELGEFRFLKREFGVTRMDLVDPRDPDTLVGLMVLAELRENPGLDLAETTKRVERVKRLEVHMDDEEDDEDPTREGSEDSSPEPEPSGSGDGSPEGSR